MGRKERKEKALKNISKIGADPKLAVKQVNWGKISDESLDRFQASGNPKIKARAKQEIRRRSGAYK